ncbi:hypothetical protein AB0N61_03055 [Microbacterium sp. NPDC089320]|uniref:hypothetical protein n=1 Tax=Microbacterium sp. NPDC089320 TaxID=3155182 RepID=UPI003420B9E6
MSDIESTPDDGRAEADESPMIPDELAPRQQSEDPVPNDPDAAGTKDRNDDEDEL